MISTSDREAQPPQKLETSIDYYVLWPVRWVSVVYFYLRSTSTSILHIEMKRIIFIYNDCSIRYLLEKIFVWPSWWRCCLGKHPSRGIVLGWMLRDVECLTPTRTKKINKSLQIPWKVRKYWHWHFQPLKRLSQKFRLRLRTPNQLVEVIRLLCMVLPQSLEYRTHWHRLKNLK